MNAAPIVREAPTTLLFLAIGLIACAANARAAVPAQDIATGGPLTHVWVGNDLSCEVARAGDAHYSLYPFGSFPASCGTLVSVGDTLLAPDFGHHDGAPSVEFLGAYVPFTEVSQSAVGGTGTTADPLAVATIADAGTTGLRITEVDTYVVGQEAYRTDV